jgi:hypothetical protein
VNVSAVGSWIDGRGNRARPGRGSGTAPCSPQLANAARAIRWIHQNRAIGRCQRFQPGATLGEAFHTHISLPGLCERRPPRLSLSSPNANYQCRDAPGLGGPGSSAPACSPDVNWWLVQNMRCVHLPWSGQAICGAGRRVCSR